MQCCVAHRVLPNALSEILVKSAPSLPFLSHNNSEPRSLSSLPSHSYLPPLLSFSDMCPVFHSNRAAYFTNISYHLTHEPLFLSLECFHLPPGKLLFIPQGPAQMLYTLCKAFQIFLDSLWLGTLFFSVYIFALVFLYCFIVI